MRKVLFLGFGTEEQTTNLLLRRLSEVASEGVEATLKIRGVPLGFFRKSMSALIRLLEDYRLSRDFDQVFIYTSAALSVSLVLLFKARGKPVHIFVWDVYPASKVHAAPDSPLILIWLHGLLEKMAMACAKTLLVPSADYLPHIPVSLRPRILVFPIWPTMALARRSNKTQEDTFRIVFAGQVLSSRGLNSAVEHLNELFQGRFQLHVYSAGSTQLNLFGGLSDKIVLHSFLNQSELIEKAYMFDFGLICLDLAYPLPAAPSKSMLYVSAGLPILYFGPKNSFFDCFLRGRVGIDITRMRSINEFNAAAYEILEDLDENICEAFESLDLKWSKIAKIL